MPSFCPSFPHQGQNEWLPHWCRASGEWTPFNPIMLGDSFGITTWKNCMSLWEAFAAQLVALSPCQPIQTSCTSCILVFRGLYPWPSAGTLKLGHMTLPVQRWPSGPCSSSGGPPSLRVLGVGLSMGLFEDFSHLPLLFVGGFFWCVIQSLANWQKVCWSYDLLWRPWPHLPMWRYWKMSHLPIGLRSHLLRWQSPPQGSTAIAGPIGLMLEDCFQQLMTKDGKKPQPLPRWQVKKPLQPRRWSQNRKIPSVNDHHPTRLCGNCMITVWG